MNPAVQKAIATIMQALGEHESRAMGSKQGVVVEVEPAATHAMEGEECAACAAGTCDDPAHMSEEDMAGMQKTMRY